MATTDIAVVPAAEDHPYRGVTRLPDGKCRSIIVNRENYEYTIGEFPSAEAAALAHDRVILAILGPDASAEFLNFRAAFSDTELRFLRGRHNPTRCVMGVVNMLRKGSYDAEFARFAEHAFDAYMDPELAHDVANFVTVHEGELLRRKEAAVAAAGDVDPAARAKAERDAEREAFLEGVKNKAADQEWVKSYHRRRQQFGLTFEDENRWPLIVPTADNVGDDWPPGEELLYLPHGSSYVDEMLLPGSDLTNKEHHRA